MELIPILSTIILVATISTFMLAIGAYFLYKVREGKGQQMAAPIPSTVKAELITPAEVHVQAPQPEQRIAPQPIYIEPQSVPAYQQETAYAQPRMQQRAGAPQQYVSQPKQYPEAGFSEIKKYPATTSETKFVKYTGDGSSTPVKKEKNSGALKWQ